MKKITLLFLTAIIACSTPKEISKSRNNKISKLVFRHFHEISEEGEHNGEIVRDSLIAQWRKEHEADSADLEMPNLPTITEILKATPENEIHIELSQDTIWRYQTENGKIIGDYSRIDKEKGIIYAHAKIDKSIMYQQFNLFEMGEEYSIEEYPNEKKRILGYNCFKVAIRKKEQRVEDFPLSIGDTIYEMYVTEEIDLPVHALFNFTKNFSKFFPLEVREWQENLTISQEVYEIKEIK